MSYSRRQLEAFGETLGDSVTRKEAGRVVYGGGGGGSPSTQTTISDVPGWAKDTAERTLAKADALTSGKPYQSFTNWANQEGIDPNRVAGFTGLQNKSFQGAQNLQTAPGLEPAMGMAGAGTYGSLNAGQNYMNMATNPNSMQGFMSPYMQNVVNSQMAEANRNYDIGATKQASQATQAGAFGGSRDAIMAAENERNRNTALNGIQAQGLQSAFDNAQKAQQFGSTLGLQGYGQAVQGAGQMANIGNQQFGQQKDILGLQNQFGAQQQANEQSKLGYNMQDYSAAMQYPYQQLSFLSNILHGTPMGGVQTMYGAQSTPAQNIAALGGLGVGVGGMMNAFSKASKEGGLMSSYADGGSVEDPQNIESIVSKMSDAQLQQAMEASKARGDVQEMQAIQAEMAMRASERQGMAGAFNQLPQEQQQSMMAGGGIVAFAGGGNLGSASTIYDPVTGVPISSESTSGNDLTMLESLGIFNPENRRALERMDADARKREEAKNKPKASQAETDAKAKAAADAELARLNLAKPAAPAAPVAAPAGSITAALNNRAAPAAPAAAKPERTGFDENTNKMREMLENLSKADKESVDKMLESHKKRIDKMESNGLNDAMMKFGFHLAATAANPKGNRKSLVGILGEASPAFSDAMSENQRAISAAQDNLEKMQMDQARYNTASRKGDIQSALTYAQAISADQKAQRQLDLQEKQLAATIAHQGQGNAIQQIASQLQRANPNLGVEEALMKASRIAGYSYRSEAANETKNNAAITKVMEKYAPYELFPPGNKHRETMLALRDKEIAQLQGGAPATPSNAASTGGQYAGFKVVGVQ